MRKSWVVFGQKVEIKIVADLVCQYSGNQLYGQYHHDENIIYIRKGLTLEQTQRTLYHEIGHCLLFRLGLAQTTLDHNLHEIIVEGFSNFIYENFKEKK